MCPHTRIHQANARDALVQVTQAALKHEGALTSGTQFTCFTSTKVQILTPEAVRNGRPQAIADKLKATPPPPITPLASLGGGGGGGWAGKGQGMGQVGREGVGHVEEQQLQQLIYISILRNSCGLMFVGILYMYYFYMY
jgi:hypothetical protein